MPSDSLSSSPTSLWADTHTKLDIIWSTSGDLSEMEIFLEQTADWQSERNTNTWGYKWKLRKLGKKREVKKLYKPKPEKCREKSEQK